MLHSMPSTLKGETAIMTSCMLEEVVPWHANHHLRSESPKESISLGEYIVWSQEKRRVKSKAS